MDEQLTEMIHRADIEIENLLRIGLQGMDNKVNRAEYQIEKLKEEYSILQGQMDHCIDIAWGIIANAGEGDWRKEHPHWVEAAAQWRDTYLPETSRRNAERAKLNEQSNSPTEAGA